MACSQYLSRNEKKQAISAGAVVVDGAFTATVNNGLVGQAEALPLRLESGDVCPILGQPVRGRRRAPE